MHTELRKLYLPQLSTTTVPLPQGRSMEMVLPSYLVLTAANKRILIDTGMAPDALPSGSLPAQNEKNVLEHLSELKLRPSDIDTLICTHFDLDHGGFHDSFRNAEFIVHREHYELARSGHPRFAHARSHWDHPALRYRLVDRDSPSSKPAALLRATNPFCCACRKPGVSCSRWMPSSCSVCPRSTAEPGPTTIILLPAPTSS